MAAAESKGQGGGNRARVRARRCAVQALYQWQMAGQDPGDILNEFVAEREVVNADIDYFQTLTCSIPRHITQLEADLQSVLDRRVRELDPVERAILLIGAYELRYCVEVPWRVVINEAIELEKMFGAQQGHRYINTVLDKLARLLRPTEIAAALREDASASPG
ncbi:MAG: transcription antitermination factor NusB [Chromatiales bacterium]